ncbi:MAG: hypothetical protein WDW38_009154 [Sanguina aurantia]
MSVFVQTSLVVPTIMSADGHVLTQPFLELCRLCIPIVERLGTAFILVKTDISGNIKRLADKALTDPDRYRTLFTIVQDEMVCNAHGHGTSCTKGLLWLKRAMEFTVAILLKLQEDDQIELCKAVKDTYALTLQRFHGFIASTAFSLAFNFVPTREDFEQSLGSDARSGMAEFTTGFGPVLAEIQAFMIVNNLDDPTRV